LTTFLPLPDKAGVSSGCATRLQNCNTLAELEYHDKKIKTEPLLLGIDEIRGVFCYMSKALEAPLQQEFLFVVLLASLKFGRGGTVNSGSIVIRVMPDI
jgi:hypothetical protein